MGTGAVKGHHTPSTSECQLMTSQKKTVACEACAVNFTFFKRKKICNECQLFFCSTCLPKETHLSNGSRRCRKCRFLLNGNFSYSELMELKIKDLRDFLSRHNIPTSGCTEKNDLVELVLHHYGNDVYRSQQEENRRHLEELAIRRREEEPSSISSTPSDDHDSEHGDHGNIIEDGHVENHYDIPSQPDTNQPDDHNSEQESPQPDEETVPVPPKRLKLDDIENIDQVEVLTNRQLKEILACNFVDFKGCCERWELESRVRKLWCDNEKNKEKAKFAEISEAESGIRCEDLCKICIDAVIDCVLLECGHMITCTKCGKQLSECPICRQYVVRVVRIFKA